eukprot:GHVN01002278.1.p1 GENE.GHVN01002278.1~~GHVN01002278.1.p1  ORF type:complete len:145 (+),score=20.23 GHVN01002278.1:59-436(+)
MMASQSNQSRRPVRLPPEVSRILYVRNLPYKITAEELYDIFAKYGPIRQIRRGTNNETKGTCFVVYDDIFDAKNAVDHLSGFRVSHHYLVALYYNPVKAKLKLEAQRDAQKRDEELSKLRARWEK